MKKLIEYLTERKLWPLVDVLLFVVITYGFHKLWWAFDDQIFRIPAFSAMTAWLAHTIFSASAWVDGHILFMNILLHPINVIHFNSNNTAICVNDSCSGFKQMWQVLILFLLIPGPWKQKLWFIPVGLVAIFFCQYLKNSRIKHSNVILA